jgi:hypothetical protein
MMPVGGDSGIGDVGTMTLSGLTFSGPHKFWRGPRRSAGKLIAVPFMSASIGRLKPAAIGIYPYAVGGLKRLKLVLELLSRRAGVGARKHVPIIFHGQ